MARVGLGRRLVASASIAVAVAVVWSMLGGIVAGFSLLDVAQSTWIDAGIAVSIGLGVLLGFTTAVRERE